MREPFPFEFEFEGGVTVSGQFFAYRGYVETIEFSDGEYVESRDGRTIAVAKTPFMHVLANAVLGKILKRFEDEIDGTRAVERWSAPIRIGRVG